MSVLSTRHIDRASFRTLTRYLAALKRFCEERGGYCSEHISTCRDGFQFENCTAVFFCLEFDPEQWVFRACCTRRTNAGECFEGDACGKHRALAAVERACKENRNLSVVLYDIEGSGATGYEAWLLSD